LKRSDKESRFAEVKEERYGLFALAAFLLLLLEALPAPLARRATLPDKSKTGARGAIHCNR
jgi:hypothetical protein